MYSLSQLKKGLERPFAAAREINRIYHTKGRQADYNVGGADIHDEDWDNLIILDSCRPDYLYSEYSTDGIWETRISRGAATQEFVTGNFKNRTLQDTVLVSSNPWYLRLKEFIEFNLHNIVSNFDGDPVTTTKKTKRTVEKHPNKRIISHYIPPHPPYTGPTAQEHFTEFIDNQYNVHRKIRERGYPTYIIRQAYRENLRQVLPHLEELVETLRGKTVITADHGQMLGERYSPFPSRGFGHHKGIYVKELVEVPWIIEPFDERREIQSESPTATDPSERETTNEQINQRLRDLGYKI